MHVSPAYEINRHPADDGTLRLVLVGEIDVAAHDELHQAIMAAVDSGVREVVIDLHGVTFFDSGAVGVLVAGHSAARRAGCPYRLVEPPELVRRVLETNGILHLLTDGQQGGSPALT